MHEHSPISHGKNTKAPTLILADLADYRVPPIQSLNLYRAPGTATARAIPSGSATSSGVGPVEG